MYSRCRPRPAPNCSGSSEHCPSTALGFASSTLSPQAGRGIAAAPESSLSPPARLRGEGWGEGLIRRRFGVVFLGAERAALIALGDRVFWLIGLAGEDLGSVWLTVVLRLVAEPVSIRIVVPRALVAGDAVDDLEMDLGMLEADTHELGVVARADPDREAAAVDRLLAEIADTRAQKPDAVLVGIEAGERFGE